MNTLDFQEESPTQIDGPGETEEELALEHSFSDELEPGAVNTVTVTSQEDDEPAEDVVVYLNGQNQGSTNSDGELIVNIPEETPIEVEFVSDEHDTESVEYTDFDTDTLTRVSDEQDTDDETADEDTDTEEDTDETDENGEETEQEDTEEEEEAGEVDSQGFVLENTPQTNTDNTLTLYDNGETITEATVYLDGENIGETDQQGQIEFTAPNQETFTLETPENNIEESTHILTDYESDTDLNALYEYSPENPAIGTTVELDAAVSEGDIETYTWNSPDTELDQITGETITHQFAETETFTVQLETEDTHGETDTHTREIEVEDAPEPVFNFRTPGDGSEHEETELEYDFTIYNAVEGATYNIISNGETQHTNTLNEGTNEITTEITLPDGEQQTKIEVEQAGETFTSDTRTIHPGHTLPDPEFSMDKPKGTQEVFFNENNVNFSYTVEERGWAEEAVIDVLDEEHNHIQSINTGTYSTVFPDLEASEEGEEYQWELTLQNVDESQSKSESFTLEKVEPDHGVELISPTEGEEVEDYQDVETTVAFDSEVSGELHIEIIAAEDGSNSWSSGEASFETEYEEGDVAYEDFLDIVDGMDSTHTFTHDADVAIEYEWRSWIEYDDGTQIGLTDYENFEVTDEP